MRSPGLINLWCADRIVGRTALEQYYPTDPPDHLATTFCNLTPRYCRLVGYLEVMGDVVPHWREGCT